MFLLYDHLFQELWENVAVVFHSAACISFDIPLTSAILLNVRGTKELLELGKSMKKLEVLFLEQEDSPHCIHKWLIHPYVVLEKKLHHVQGPQGFPIMV